MKERIMIDNKVKSLIPSKYKDLTHWLSETKNWTDIRIRILNAPDYIFPIIEVDYEMKPEDRIYRERFDYLISQCGRVV